MRSYQESCKLLDRIVGRCVRDAVFARAVLDDPEDALAPYELTDDEMDDFRALKRGHRDEAETIWAAIRAVLRPVRDSA
jgi:hypothetical protein